MILADTSVWINHLRYGDAVLAAWLETGDILTHPFVIGELALGHLRARDGILADLRKLPRVKAAEDHEVMRLIEHIPLFGIGIGYVDAHLLAAVRLTPGAALWTRDRRLAAVADRLSLAVTIGVAH